MNRSPVRLRRLCTGLEPGRSFTLRIVAFDAAGNFKDNGMAFEDGETWLS